MELVNDWQVASLRGPFDTLSTSTKLIVWNSSKKRNKGVHQQNATCTSLLALLLAIGLENKIAYLYTYDFPNQRFTKTTGSSYKWNLIWREWMNSTYLEDSWWAISSANSSNSPNRVDDRRAVTNYLHADPCKQDRWDQTPIALRWIFRQSSVVPSSSQISIYHVVDSNRTNDDWFSKWRTARWISINLLQ